MMIGIGTPNSQSRMPRPIFSSYCRGARTRLVVSPSLSEGLLYRQVDKPTLVVRVPFKKR
jgi:hypothetical protein